MSREGERAPKAERLVLTVEEAAERLGVSRGLGYAAARNGEIPVIRIGRRILVPRGALEAMLSGRQNA